MCLVTKTKQMKYVRLIFTIVIFVVKKTHLTSGYANLQHKLTSAPRHGMNPRIGCQGIQLQMFLSQCVATNPSSPTVCTPAAQLTHCNLNSRTWLGFRGAETTGVTDPHRACSELPWSSTTTHNYTPIIWLKCPDYLLLYISRHQITTRTAQTFSLAILLDKK